jgi:hypothetical protein
MVSDIQAYKRAEAHAAHIGELRALLGFALEALERHDPSSAARYREWSREACERHMSELRTAAESPARVTETVG